MYYTVELVLKSYMPLRLEPGMWFITKMNPGTRKEYSEIWALDKAPFETLEEFIVKNGAPVEPFLIYEEQVLAEPHEIGWWDEGEQTDELRDVTLKDINTIINEWNGWVDVEVDEWDYLNEDVLSPIFYANKVTMCTPFTYEEEEEENGGGVWMCSHCNGSGYGITPDVPCPVCHGEGEIYIDEDEDNS